MPYDDILKVLTGSAGALAIMIAWLRWGNADRNRLLAALDQSNAARIHGLEEGFKRCAEDRIGLHQNISDMQKVIDGLQVELRSILMNQIKRQNNEHHKA